MSDQTRNYSRRFAARVIPNRGKDMTEPENQEGLGSFLKSERERKGLSLEQLTRITRLRIQYVEALENENWDRLPSPVFIRGFIKSYTKALGLDYREVISQFQSTIPAHDDLPRPLVPPKKKSAMKSAVLIAVGVIAVSLIVVLFMTDTLFHPEKRISKPEKVTEDRAQDQGYTADNVQDRRSIQNSIQGNRATETDINAALRPGTEPSGTDIQSPDGGTSAPERASLEPYQPPVQKTVEEPVAAVEGKYNLTAYVMERTYIKIYADNEPPREFIFSPGSYPQWTADEGFFLLIGNAAGVEFDFNGKRITDLGESGDVVRLRLPEDFNPDINE